MILDFLRVEKFDRLCIEDLRLLDIDNVSTFIDHEQSARVMILDESSDRWQKHVVLGSHNIEGRYPAILDPEEAQEWIDSRGKAKPPDKFFLVEFFGFFHKEIP